MTGLDTAAVYILQTIGSLYLLIVLLRFILQLVRADFRRVDDAERCHPDHRRIGRLQVLVDSFGAAFAAQPERIRLLGGRDVGRADRVLSLEVTAFEARYAAPGATPDIVITARGRVTVLPTRAVVEDRVFNIVQPAAANRVSSIVEAFDIAVRDLNTQVVDWTETATPAG